MFLLEDFGAFCDAIAGGDVSAVWETWSYAAEFALIEAFCASGGSILVKGFVRWSECCQVQKDYWWAQGLED